MAISSEPVRPSTSQIAGKSRTPLMEISSPEFVQAYDSMRAAPLDPVQQYIRQPLADLNLVAGDVGGLSEEVTQNLTVILDEITEVFGTPYLLQLIATLYKQELVKKVRIPWGGMEEHAAHFMMQLEHEGTANFLSPEEVLRRIVTGNYIRTNPQASAFTMDYSDHLSVDALAYLLGEEKAKQYRYSLNTFILEYKNSDPQKQMDLKEDFEREMIKRYATEPNDAEKKQGVLASLLGIYGRYLDELTPEEQYAAVDPKNEQALDAFTAKLWEENHKLVTCLEQTRPLLEMSLRHIEPRTRLQEKNTMFVMAAVDKFLQSIRDHVAGVPSANPRFDSIKKFSAVYADLYYTSNALRKDYTLKVDSFDLQQPGQRPTETLTSKEVRLSTKALTPTYSSEREKIQALLEKRGKQDEQTVLAYEENVEYHVLRAAVRRKAQAMRAGLPLAQRA